VIYVKNLSIKCCTKRSLRKCQQSAIKRLNEAEQVFLNPISLFSLFFFKIKIKTLIQMTLLRKHLPLKHLYWMIRIHFWMPHHPTLLFTLLRVYRLTCHLIYVFYITHEFSCHVRYLPGPKKDKGSEKGAEA
jgi:hypothetical protein